MSKTSTEATKKINMIGVKVDEPTKNKLEEIRLSEDRPLGYVVRELMMRGLAAYLRDGRLKEPKDGSAAPPRAGTIKGKYIRLGKEEERKKRA